MINDTQNARLTQVIDKLLSRPVFYAVMATILVTALSIGTALLTFRSDERVFFSESNPRLVELQKFEAKYGKDDNVIFVVHYSEDSMFAEGNLNAIADLTESTWSLPFVERVDSPTNYQIAIGDKDGLSIDNWWRKGDPIDQERMARNALNDTLLIDRLLSRDMKTSLVVGKLSIPKELSEDASVEIMKAARELADTFRTNNPNAELYLSGSVALDKAFGEASASDTMLLVPAMFIIFLLLLWVLVGSIYPITSCFLVIGGSIGASMGIAGLAGIPLSSVSVAAPFVIAIISIADTVHLTFASAQHRRDGKSSKEAVQLGLHETFWPIFLTSLTTGLGFASLAFSEAPPFAHLGIISAIGSFWAFVLTVTIVPAILMNVNWKPGRQVTKVQSIFARIGRHTVKRPKLAVTLSLLPMAILASFAFSNALDDRYVQYFDQRFEFRQDTDKLNEYIGGFYTLDYALKADGEGGVSEFQYLSDIEKLTAWFRTQPEVTHVGSHSDRMKTIHRALFDGHQSEFKLSEDRELNSQMLSLYELQLPYGRDLGDQMTVDKAESRLTVSLKDISTSQMLSLEKRAEDWAKVNLTQLNTGLNATGTSSIFSYIGIRNIENMVWGSLFAIITISLVIMLAFRNLKITLIALVANIIPSLAALGGWALIVGEVGMAVATIMVVTLGIVVDDTIHLISSIRREHKQGLPIEEAVVHGLSASGSGVFATSVILFSGFIILAVSGFKINAWMGLMTAIVSLIAFMFDIVFIPAVMTLMFRNKPKLG